MKSIERDESLLIFGFARYLMSIQKFHFLRLWVETWRYVPFLFSFYFINGTKEKKWYLFLDPIRAAVCQKRNWFISTIYQIICIFWTFYAVLSFVFRFVFSSVSCFLRFKMHYVDYILCKFTLCLLNILIFISQSFLCFVLRCSKSFLLSFPS